MLKNISAQKIPDFIAPLAMAHVLIHKNSLDARVERAALLAQKYAFASEVLAFYGEVAKFQRRLVSYLQSCDYTASGGGDFLPGSLDLVFLLPQFKSFLEMLGNIAPPA